MRKKDDVVLTEEHKTQLTESAFEALRICEKVDSLFSKSVRIPVRNEFGVYMQTNFSTSREMIEDGPNSQTAAIIHELVHDRDDLVFLDTGYSRKSEPESIPLLAEALFTGQNRIDLYFKQLTEDITPEDWNWKRHGRHIKGWNEAMNFMNQEIDADNNLNTLEDRLDLMNKARSMEEDDKIKLIQKAIRSDMGLKEDQ